jgi:DhnA family fructose-bisphosphate aldolase class Ia
MGAAWELDDRPTAYTPQQLSSAGLDGGKMLLRIADDDAGTAPTLEWAARVVSECVDLHLPMMVEPLPYRHTTLPAAPGTAKLLDDEDALLRAVAIGASLGYSGASTWLKVPASKDPRRMLSVTTLPALILGGAPGPDPAATYRSWEQAMEVPNVRGLVVGRALLYPPDGDVAAAIDRAAKIVRPGP